jgi:hypothetical protein
VPVWADADALHVAMADKGSSVGLRAVAPAIDTTSLPAQDRPLYLASHLGAERIHTLGRWGPSA